MYPILSLDEAARQSWDVIVAGSSFAAMFFVYALPRDLRVLIIEKGKFFSHSDQLQDGRHTREVFNQINTSGTEKAWIAHTQYGGNSNCWSGQVLRMLPEDFQMHRRFGIERDWPVSYDELEPLYQEAEDLMKVNGGGSDHRLPRSKPFPYPAHIPSRSDVVLREFSDDWFAAPSARSRELCCANGVCHLCPIDAKWSILNGFVPLRHPNAKMVLGTEVRQVAIQNARATGAVLHSADREVEIDSNLVALGTNAIFNAAILLRTGLRADALGRNLHEQNGRTVLIDAPVKNYFGGTKITGLGFQFYADTPRSDRGAVLVENHNSPARLRTDKDRWTERLVFKLVSDDLTNPDNRVTLDNAEEVQIQWQGHSQYSRDGLDHAISNLQSILPFEIERLSAADYTSGKAHIQGTHRMGKTLQDSVIDAHLRTHEVSNLLALGSGAFPTCSPANPTLTLAALSILAARSI